jgi:hypothetical protein
MWYALHRVSDGGFLGLAEAPLGPGIPGPEIGAVPYEVKPNLTVVMWDPAQKLFVPRAPVGVRVISKRAFSTRLTGEQRRYLIALRDTPTTPSAVRAGLTDATELRDQVTAINLDDPAVVEYVPFATDLLISGGLVPAGDRTAFIANWRRDAGPGEAA